MLVYVAALTVGGRLMFLSPSLMEEQAAAQARELAEPLESPDDEVSLWEMEISFDGPGEARLITRYPGGTL